MILVSLVRVVKSLPPSASSALVIMRRRRYDQGMTDRLSAYTYIPAKQNGRDFKNVLQNYNSNETATLYDEDENSADAIDPDCRYSLAVVVYVCFCTPQLDRRLYRWILSHVQRKS